MGLTFQFEHAIAVWDAPSPGFHSPLPALSRERRRLARIPTLPACGEGRVGRRDARASGRGQGGGRRGLTATHVHHIRALLWQWWPPAWQMPVSATPVARPFRQVARSPRETIPTRRFL